MNNTVPGQNESSHRCQDRFGGTLHPVIMAVPKDDCLLKGREMVDALRRHARKALATAVQISGLTLGPLEKDDKGAPLPSNGHYWSLSHKTANVAAVVAPCPVGIDIEALRPCHQSLYRRIASSDEWRLAPEVSERIFFRYWTAKEAVLKAVGKGIVALSRCRIHQIVDDTHMELSYDGSVWRVAQCWTADDHIAAVTATDNRIQWHLM